MKILTNRLEDREGEIRQRTRFLWFPKTIGKETRWLETATWWEIIEEGQYASHTGGFEGPTYLKWKWRPMCWNETVRPDPDFIK